MGPCCTKSPVAVDRRRNSIGCQSDCTSRYHAARIRLQQNRPGLFAAQSVESPEAPAESEFSGSYSSTNPTPDLPPDRVSGSQYASGGVSDSSARQHRIRGASCGGGTRKFVVESGNSVLSFRMCRPVPPEPQARQGVA